MALLSRFAVALGLVAAFAAPALASPAGMWEFETKDTRVRIDMCGDGTALCGTLVWLKDTDYNKQYEPYLDTLMVNTAKASGPNRWRGDMNMFGHSGSGTITQVGPDQISLKGCFMLVVCKTYQLYRMTE